MITIESLGSSQASLSRLSKAMQAEPNFVGANPAATLLNNWRIAARVGVMSAALAVENDEALGVVTIQFEPAKALGKIRSLFIVPGATRDVAAQLVSLAVDKVWANDAIQHLNATFVLNQPGVRAAFEARDAHCVPRQEMRINGFDGLAWNAPLAAGFRFEPWSAERIEDGARVYVQAFEGTIDESLFPELASLEGISNATREIVEDNKLGIFDPVASMLAYKGDRMVGALLCADTSERLGYVIDIAVLPDCRRNGLARSMLSHALSAFANAQLEGAQLWVTDENPARALYESLGFETYEQSWTYIARR